MAAYKKTELEELSGQQLDRTAAEVVEIELEADHTGLKIELALQPSVEAETSLMVARRHHMILAVLALAATGRFELARELEPVGTGTS